LSYYKAKKYTPTEFSKNELRFKITNSPSPCVQGGFSTFLSSNQILDLDRVSRLSPIIGSVRYNNELDILSITGKNQERFDIFRDGSIIIKGKVESEVTKQIRTVIKTLYRVLHCDGCGICTYQCSKRALEVDSGVVKVFEDSCNQCLRCNDYCPLLRYRDIESFFELEKDRKTQNGVINVAV
jgi:ferredoxin